MDYMTLALHPLKVSDWTVVVSGISIVLGTLFVLILVFYAFGAIVSRATNKGKKASNNKKDVVVPPSNTLPTKPTQAPPVEQGVSGEVVAAISAAVYAMDGNSNATITSITPVRKQNPITGRNPWANAAVVDNTRPF